MKRALVSTRRDLLSASLMSLGWMLSARSGHAVQPGAVQPASGGPVLVCVFLRGAADGLSILVPHADEEYYRLRPSIAVPPPGARGGAIDLDGRFGLHPRLQPLKAAYDAGQLALVPAAGSPHPTRSHFEAQDFMETGAVGTNAAARGWLGRYFAVQRATGPGLVRAVALSGRSSPALRGYPDAIVSPSLSDFRLEAGGALDSVLSQGFRRLYREDAPSLAERAGRRALDATEVIARALHASRRSRGKYARDMQAFAEVAGLIKADIGLECAWIDLPGWDTHRQQGSSTDGELSPQLNRLGQALATFRADLGPAFERVVVVVMSEFGRTAGENGTGGTDHGHGGTLLVLGGPVKGGRVLGQFPVLAPEQLYEGRDVPVTTDFRDVLAEICERHLRLPDAAALFPGFQLDRARRLGLLA